MARTQDEMVDKVSVVLSNVVSVSGERSGTTLCVI